MLVNPMEERMPPLFVDWRHKADKPTPGLDKNQGPVRIESKGFFLDLRERGLLATTGHGVCKFGNPLANFLRTQSCRMMSQQGSWAAPKQDRSNVHAGL